MKETEKETINQKLSNFLTNNKKILFLVLAILACIIIVFGILSKIQQKNRNIMVNKSVEIETLYHEVSHTDGDVESFITVANEGISKFPGTKAELMAYVKLASYYFDEKDFEKSEEYYTLAYTKFPKDLGVTVYMFNAAMSLEEQGKINDAIIILEKIVADFKSDNLEVPDKSYDIPEVIFNLGRLNEAKGDNNKAIEYYEILVAEYKSYNLSNLAKTRLLTIK